MPKDVTHILATAIVRVKSVNNEWIPARALIDTGSMAHFITARLAARLRTRMSKAATPVMGLFGGQKINQLIHITMKSCASDYEASIQTLVLPVFDHIHPSVRLDINQLQLPSNVKFADPTFNEPQRVDMIIGVGLAFNILMVGQIQLVDNLLLQKTILGWLVAGELVNNPNPTHKLALSGTSQDCDQLQAALERFWELEKVPEQLQNWSQQELFCENHFRQHTTRKESGRFVVRLPFLSNPDDELGESYQVAETEGSRTANGTRCRLQEAVRGVPGRVRRSWPHE